MDAKLVSLSLALVLCLFGDLVAAQACRGLDKDEYLHAGNIADFRGCRVINGDLRIIGDSFTGDRDRNIYGITERDLQDLRGVEEIWGHLSIQGVLAVTTLDFLDNLEVIRGRTGVSSLGAALQIYGTNLESLELSSLTSIEEGDIVIGYNMDLCYVANLNWGDLLKSTNQQVTVSFNKKYDLCASEGHTCDYKCASKGCWGPGPQNCFGCDNYFLMVNGKQECLESCYSSMNLYLIEGTYQCAECNSECDECYGPRADQCQQCKNYRNGNTCVPQCGTRQFVNSQNQCEDCHPQCMNGCTGYGSDQCDSCRKYIDGGACVEVCSRGKYADSAGICRACDPECAGSCSGPDGGDCYACRHVRMNGRCAPECPDYMYADSNGECQSCDNQCRLGCYGPGPANCESCMNYREGNLCVPSCRPDDCADERGVCEPCKSSDIVMPSYEELVKEVMELKKRTQYYSGEYRYDHPVISFTAYASPERADYYSGDHIMFDQVITNIGGGYLPDKSTFVCPRDGVYMFAVSVDNYMRASLVPSIYKGRELIASAGAYNSASQTVIIECDAGENVFVRTSQAGTMFNQYGWKTSTFTGYLIANAPIPAL